MLDTKGSAAIEEAWSQLRPLGFAVVPYLRSAYPRFRYSEGRSALVFYATCYARISDAAFQLGREALNDRAYSVRHRACGLLAYSLRLDGLSHLKACLTDKTPLVRESAAAAMRAIKRQNHNLFVDRDMSGRVMWQVNPGEGNIVPPMSVLARARLRLGYA